MPAPRPLLPNDRLLRQKCKKISLRELRTNHVQGVIDQLLDYVYANSKKTKPKTKKRPRVVGLSANQIGYDLSIAIVDLAIGHKNYNDIHVLINPTITWSSKSLLERDEGCVNLPDVRGFVKRSKRVRVDAFDRSGNKLSLDLNGWAAILLQHEVGHLNGQLFIDYLPDPKKAHLVKPENFSDYKNKKKTWDKFVDVSKLSVKPKP
jgi:peptide deformylase